MNGLEFLEQLMRLRPTPVVMLSTLTGARSGGQPIRALELGAFDCFDKAALPLAVDADRGAGPRGPDPRRGPVPARGARAPRDRVAIDMPSPRRSAPSPAA